MRICGSIHTMIFYVCKRRWDAFYSNNIITEWYNQMQDINKLKQYASQWIVENKQTFHAVADEIWSNPELG